MKSLSIASAIVLLTLLLSSCKVTRTISFDGNFSGAYEMVIDMSMMSVLQALDSTNAGEKKPILTQEESAAMVSQIGSTPGVSDVNISETEDNIITISYRFNGITSLNQSMENFHTTSFGKMTMENPSSEPVKMKGEYVVMKGKNFTYFDKGIATARAGEDGKKDMPEEDNPMGGNMLEYSLVLNFPRPVKSAKNSHATLSNGNLTVTYKVNDEEMMDPKVSPKIKIKM